MIVNVSKKYDQRSTVYTDFYLSFCHLPFSYESSTGPPIAWIRPRAEADLSNENKHEKGLTGKNFSAYFYCSTVHVTPRRCYQGVYKALTVLKNPRVVILWSPRPRLFLLQVNFSTPPPLLPWFWRLWLVNWWTKYRSWLRFGNKLLKWGRCMLLHKLKSTWDLTSMSTVYVIVTPATYICTYTYSYRMDAETNTTIRQLN